MNIALLTYIHTYFPDIDSHDTVSSLQVLKKWLYILSFQFPTK